MSFERKCSFSKKSQLESEGDNVALNVVTDYKQNGDIDLESPSPSHSQETAAKSSVNDEMLVATEQSSQPSVSQPTDNHEKLENSSVEISSLNDTGDNATAERRDLGRHQSEHWP